MKLHDLFRRGDINEGVRKFRQTKPSGLLDVRTPDEYSGGHIPGSKNIPLQDIAFTASIIKDKNMPVFVYCYSGARSRQAAGALIKLGYTRVADIGGIDSYNGEVER